MENLNLSIVEKENLALNILADAAIFENISGLICQLSGGYFDPGMYYSGLNNALPLLGIPNPKNEIEEDQIGLIKDNLYEILSSEVRRNANRNDRIKKNPDQLAKDILIRFRALKK
jgi:hypothetical protein